MEINSQENINKRFKWNIIMFLIGYVLINLLRGIVFDSYINYLQQVSPVVARSFSSYQGMATFLSALMILMVNKVGYKRTILMCPISAVVAISSILLINNTYVYQLMTVILLVSTQLFIAILPPFLTTYTSLKNRTKWYSKAYWIGYFGWALTTYIGGFATVYRFSVRINQPFGAAKDLTRHLETLNPMLESGYIQANKDILLMSAIIAAIAIIPIFLIKEEKDDYFVEKTDVSKNIFKRLKNASLGQDAFVFLIYIAIVNFSMGLFAPYFTVFLNRSLHIDRSTASLMLSITYMATVLFIMIGPRFIYRFGHITTLVSSVLLSLPFMLIIANGDKFGKYTIPVVGMALFFRSGIANMSEPVESALPMETVAKENRTLMSFMVNTVNGIMSIISGYFTGNFLFLTNDGYRYGYYIAACLYIVAMGIMFFYFRSRYDDMSKGQMSLDKE